MPLTTQFEEPGVIVNCEGRIRERQAVTEPAEQILSGHSQLTYLAYSAARRDSISRQDIIYEIFSSTPGFYSKMSEDLNENGQAWLKKYTHRNKSSVSLKKPGGGRKDICSWSYIFSDDRRARVQREQNSEEGNLK